MKNIHIIQTDKPSRLYFDSKLFVSPKYQLSSSINSIVQGKNIYITNDEEIKEGDWVIEYVFDNLIFKAYSSISEFVKKSKFHSFHRNHCKKIILTTDQDLIKDGVQAIDDEFLEWFVKNPSCEEIEIKLVEQRSHLSLNDWIDADENGKFPISIAGAFCYRKTYKIIIQTEEPKQIKCYCGHTITCDCGELELECKDCNKSLENCTCIEDTIDMKQETLEEAAENYASKNSCNRYNCSDLKFSQSFKLGAK